jgi:hypothetical protein
MENFDLSIFTYLGRWGGGLSLSVIEQVDQA